MASNTKKIAIGITIGISLLGSGIGSLYVSIKFDKLNKYVCEKGNSKHQVKIDSIKTVLVDVSDSLTFKFDSLKAMKDSFIKSNADSLLRIRNNSLSDSLMIFSDSLAMLDSINNSFPQFKIDNVKIVLVLSKGISFKKGQDLYLPGGKVKKITIDFSVTAQKIDNPQEITPIYIGLNYKGKVYGRKLEVDLPNGETLIYNKERSIQNDAENTEKSIILEPEPTKKNKGYPNGIYTLFFRTQKEELAKYTIEFKAQ